LPSKRPKREQRHLAVLGDDLEAGHAHAAAQQEQLARLARLVGLEQRDGRVALQSCEGGRTSIISLFMSRLSSPPPTCAKRTAALLLDLA